MNKLTNNAKRIGCAFLAIIMACVLLTACGHSLSGTFNSEEGYSIEFNSNEDCKLYSDKNDRFAEGKYYWDEKKKCYYLEFNNPWIGNERYKAELSGKELTVKFNEKEIVFVKE